MRIPLLILILICHFFHCEAKSRFKYELSICTIFQNEAPYLAEWIEYHQLLGVDHFYLYNNNSTDNYQEVLAPYIIAKVVEVIDWPSPVGEDWTPYQKTANNNCIARYKNETNWLALIDTDEFIVPHSTDSLKKFLAPYNKMKGVAGVVINWQMFGTSGLWEIPQDKLLIESLTQKAVKTWHHNQNHKSIIKPRFCIEFKVHSGTFIEGYQHVHSEKAGPWPYVDEIQINHYWLRDERYMREVKAPRRARYEGDLWPEWVIQSYLQDTSTDVDLAIQRFVPRLKQQKGPSLH